MIVKVQSCVWCVCQYASAIVLYSSSSEPAPGWKLFNCCIELSCYLTTSSCVGFTYNIFIMFNFGNFNNNRHCKCSHVLLSSYDLMTFPKCGPIFFSPFDFSPNIVLHFLPPSVGPRSQSCIVQLLLFFGPPFSGPAFSMNPLGALCCISSRLFWLFEYCNV